MRRALGWALILGLGLAAGCTSKSSSSGGTGATGSSGPSTGTTGATGGPSSCPSCTAQNLVCNFGDGGCQACTSDADCASAGTPQPHCALDAPTSPVFGTCVACTTAVACPTGQVCDTAGIAAPTAQDTTVTADSCHADCRSNPGICPSGVAYCDPSSGLCKRGCVSTANNCADAGLLCDLDAGACVACFGPSDCPGDNPGCVNNQCGTCFANTDCPATLTCDNRNHVCFCTDSSQCGTALAPNCSVKLGVNYIDGGPEFGCGCMTTDGGLCANSTVCASGLGPHGGGECLGRCDTGATNCSARSLYCDPVSGLCGPCTRDSECANNPTGFICFHDGGLSGQCGCRVGGTGSCPSGTVCNPPLGCTISCVEDAGICAPSGICDPATGACRGCLANSDCSSSPAGTYCNTNVDAGSYTCICNSAADCVNPTGGCNSAFNRCGTCSLPTDCPANNPGCNGMSFTCGSCALDADCPTTLSHCDGGSCTM